MLNIFNKKKNQKKVARSTHQTYYIKLEIRYGVSCWVSWSKHLDLKRRQDLEKSFTEEISKIHEQLDAGKEYILANNNNLIFKRQDFISAAILIEEE